MSDDDYEQWATEGAVLAQIGQALFQQWLRISVRLPKSLAEQAVAAWEREHSEGELPEETAEQRAIRHRAAALGLIGLSLQSAGVQDGDEVLVDLDAWFIGHALDAADEDGLLADLSPPRGE